MGWLEKMGLVEVDESSIPVPETAEPLAEVACNIDVNIDSMANIVEDIFSQSGVSDRSNSIYTVQALINTLPPEMTTAKKQATVSGILSVSGKPLPVLLDDAKNRLEILEAAQNKIIEDRTAEIDSANKDIETLKEAIEMATIKIKEGEDIIEATKKAVSDEKSLIASLVEFCEGMEVSQ